MAAPTRLLIASMAIAVLWAAAAVVSAAPAQGGSTDCSAILPSVMSCLPYVQTGSKMPDPGKMCCTGVGTVMTKTPQCLCSIITSAPNFPVPIDMHRLLDLPRVCSINIPVPDCDGSSPNSSPSQAPSSQALSPSPAKAGKNSTSGATGRRGGRSAAVAGLAAAVLLSAFMS